MPVFHQFADDAEADGGFLADYRAMVERLSDELGGQPMAPEKFSMFAIMVASLPLVALMHPAIPVELHGWQVGAALLGVWLTAFCYQRPRYHRFQALWRHKLAALHAAHSDSAPVPCRFFGQATGS